MSHITTLKNENPEDGCDLISWANEWVADRILEGLSKGEYTLALGPTRAVWVVINQLKEKARQRREAVARLAPRRPGRTGGK